MVALYIILLAGLKWLRKRNGSFKQFEKVHYRLSYSRGLVFLLLGDSSLHFLRCPRLILSELALISSHWWTSFRYGLRLMIFLEVRWLLLIRPSALGNKCWYSALKVIVLIPCAFYSILLNLYVKLSNTILTLTTLTDKNWYLEKWLQLFVITKIKW